MTKMQSVFLDHFKRYPRMQTIDFLKLIYQNIFGPSHFVIHPDLNQIKHYIEEELKEAKYFPSTPIIEKIGEKYARVSLKCVLNQQLTVSELANIFYQSIQDKIDMNTTSICDLRSQTDEFIDLIKTAQIKIPLDETILQIEKYFASGIGPTHHSIAYQQAYFPHYRVVNMTFLNPNQLNEVN
ncbi:MAG: hypothetical protein WC296_05500 [Candidatus Izemoplasmatales bacterium]